MTPGILMVDDNVLAARAIERRLSATRELVWLGWADNLDDARQRIQDLSPAAVLLDVDIPEADTFGFLESAQGEWPEMAVIMFSGHTTPSLIERALKAGARGYISKDESTAVISRLVVRATKGEYVLSPLAAQLYMREATKDTALAPAAEVS